MTLLKGSHPAKTVPAYKTVLSKTKELELLEPICPSDLPVEFYNDLNENIIQ